MVRTRPTHLRNPALTPTDKLPTPNPGAVGQVAAMGDATDSPRRGNEHKVEARYRLVVDALEPAPYSGEDRRKTDRRTSAFATTLDTRKSGLDRRKAGRISLKV